MINIYLFCKRIITNYFFIKAKLDFILILVCKNKLIVDFLNYQTNKQNKKLM